MWVGTEDRGLCRFRPGDFDTRERPEVACFRQSDGLFDNLEQEEIVELVRKGPLEEAIDELADRCLSRMNGSGGRRPSKPDDLTLVAYRRG